MSKTMEVTYVMDVKAGDWARATRTFDGEEYPVEGSVYQVGGGLYVGMGSLYLPGSKYLPDLEFVSATREVPDLPEAIGTVIRARVNRTGHEVTAVRVVEQTWVASPELIILLDDELTLLTVVSTPCKVAH